MRKSLAFVLGGGGSRGALQVGALQALFEAGYQPDLLVGTSIGAVNAAFLAVHGAHPGSIPGLVEAWRDASRADLLPANYLWLSLRTIVNRPMAALFARMRGFYIAHGLDPALTFADIKGVKLVLVAADLNTGEPILYGQDPGQSVLEGLMASTALPPWISPMGLDGRLLMDGGAVSNLPIEPAMLAGAREIIALDLYDPRGAANAAPGFGQFLGKLLLTVAKRQAQMELALASKHKVSVRRIELVGREPIQMWDFQHTVDLIDQGYRIGKQAVQDWQESRSPFWQRWWQSPGSLIEVKHRVPKKHAGLRRSPP
jgi:NTE family protein